MCRLIRVGILALITVVLSALGFAQQYSQPVRDVENPAHAPFWFNARVSVSPQFSVVDQDLTNVPPGKRLVIEFVSISCWAVGVDDHIIQVQIGVTKALGGGGARYRYDLPVAKQGIDVQNAPWVAIQSLRLYSEPGAPVNVTIARSKTGETVACDVALSGYTVNFP